MNRSDPFDRVALGATDVLVSRLAWGMWRFKGDDVVHARALVDAAFDAGINLFDTADIYGFNGRDGFGDAEILLGRLLSADPSLRRRIVLASKGGIVRTCWRIRRKWREPLNPSSRAARSGQSVFPTTHRRRRLRSSHTCKFRSQASSPSSHR